MISRKRILAVVPARGGSKGVKLKNLKEVRGVPIVARVADCIQKVPNIDRGVISTDHDDIAAVAETAGLAAPFRRPENLSGDRIGDWPVLVNALEEMERIDGVTYDVVVMLQPTSPLRTPEQVNAVIEKLISEDLDSVWSVTETDLKYHPLKALAMTDSGLDFYDPEGSKIIARQQLTPVYHRNGIAYAMTRTCLLEYGNIKGERCGAVVIDGPSVSIDTLEDFDACERILSSRE